MMYAERYFSYIANQSPQASILMQEGTFKEQGVFVSLDWMHILDGNAHYALVLSQLIYWFSLNNAGTHTRITHEKDNHLWWVTTYEDISKETGVKKNTVRNAIKKFLKMGLILKEEHYSPFAVHKTVVGSPKSVSYIRPDWEGIVAALDNYRLGDTIASPAEVATGTTDKVIQLKTPAEVDAFIQRIKRENKKNSYVSTFKEDTEKEKIEYSEFRPTSIEDLPEKSTPYIYKMLQITRTNWENYDQVLRDRIIRRPIKEENDSPTSPFVYKNSVAYKYANEPGFRLWVDEIAIPKLEQITFLSRQRFVSETSDYRSYQKWAKTDEAQTLIREAIRQHEESERFLEELWT